MDSAMTRILAISVVSTALACAQEQPRLRPLPETSGNMKTGPEIGQSIPGFTAPDQNGRPRTLADLRGEKGLVLAFVRSADW